MDGVDEQEIPEHFRVHIKEPRKSRQTSLCYCVAG